LKKQQQQQQRPEILFRAKFAITWMSHVRCINILTWLRGFQDNIANFSSFFCPSVPKETWIQRKHHEI